MELGHWVTGSMGHLGHLSRSGHWVIISTRCETGVFFPVFEKNAQNAKRTFEMLKWQKSLSGVCCWTEITGCQSMQLTFTFLPVIIRNSLAWEYFFTHKSIFGVHYRIGSPGQLGLRVAGFPGHWVTKCDPVPSLMCNAPYGDVSRHTLRQKARPNEVKSTAEFGQVHNRP